LFVDPGDARYMYQLGPQGLAKIDTATWQMQWATAIPLPRFPGRNLSGLTPVFFHGYTQITAWQYLATDGQSTPLADSVITAVSDGGQLLASCTIPPIVQNPVLLPRAGIVLLPSGRAVTAYSTASGARLWQVAAELSEVSADTVYVTTTGRGARVATYGASSGRRLWSQQLKGAGPVVALTVINGIVYAQQAPAAMSGPDTLTAIRTRDGTLLWHRLITLANGPYGLQIIAVDARTVLLLPSSFGPGETAQLIDTRRGRLVTSARTNRYDPLYWQSWPAVLDRHPAIVADGANHAPAFIFTTARGYPATFGPRKGLSLAAVAQNVAYFISSSSCTPNGLEVTGVDIRNGRSLWSVPLPATLCTNTAGAPELLPYENGFAVPTVDRHVLLYR
jgi:outer membrane protein assembly factor BamB